MAVRVEAVAQSAPTRYDLDRGHVAWATAVFFCTFGGQALRAAFGFWGWGALILIALVASVVWLARTRRLRVWLYLPLPLIVFALYGTASTVWSQWPLETLLGSTLLWTTILVAAPLAVLISWEELVVALSGAVRWIVALSFVFELIVSLVIRHPILPVFLAGTDWHDAPLQWMWSRDVLFDDGKIQGIVGNSTVLGEVAAYGLIALVVQRGARLISWGWFGFWALVLLGTLVLTRSATMAIALAAVAVVLVIVLLRRRMTTTRSVVAFWAAVVAGLAVLAIIAHALWGVVLDLFGKSEDLTGRVEIWQNTIGLAVQRPAFGWGWLGYWPPWVEPLGHLNERYGTFLLQAHDAWIDLWMQVGIVGLVLFALIIVQVVWRAYRASITRTVDAASAPRPSSTRSAAPAPTAFAAPSHTWVSLFPVLLLTALLVQSITESRLLVEDGMITLVILATSLAVKPFRPERFALAPGRDTERSMLGRLRPDRLWTDRP